MPEICCRMIAVTSSEVDACTSSPRSKRSRQPPRTSTTVDASGSIAGPGSAAAGSTGSPCCGTSWTITGSSSGRESMIPR